MLVGELLWRREQDGTNCKLSQRLVFVMGARGGDREGDDAEAAEIARLQAERMATARDGGATEDARSRAARDSRSAGAGAEETLQKEKKKGGVRIARAAAGSN